MRVMLMKGGHLLPVWAMDNMDPHPVPVSRGVSESALTDLALLAGNSGAIHSNGMHTEEGAAGSNGKSGESFKTLFNEISQNVGSLQSRIRETQENVQQFFDRAKQLRARLNDRRKKRPTGMGSPASDRARPASSTVSEPEPETPFTAEEIDQVAEALLDMQMGKEEKSDAKDADTSLKLTDVVPEAANELETVVAVLENDNYKLRANVAEYQLALEMLVSQTNTELSAMKQQAKADQDLLRSELSAERRGRQQLEQENAKLHDQIQEMFWVMKNAALQEVQDTSALKGYVAQVVEENRTLHQLLEFPFPEAVKPPGEASLGSTVEPTAKSLTGKHMRRDVKAGVANPLAASGPY